MSNVEPSVVDPDVRFDMLFECAPFSVQLLAADGRTLRVNKAWEALWLGDGDDALKQYVLTEYNVLTDPQLAAKGVTPYLQRALAGEAVTMPAIVYDPAAIGRPGKPRWVRARTQPVMDATGAVREVLLFHEDVSLQMAAEQALQAGEMRLKQLANTIPQLAWMADPDGNIHWYNDRWFDYTGKTREEMQGWGWQSVHDPAVLPEVIERWEYSLVSGEPFEMTFPLLGKDGRFRPFLTLIAPLKYGDGRVLQWFGTNTDVSALHAAQQSLRDAEERLRLATRAGNIGIWEWDVARNAVSWSEEVYRLHEVPLGSFGGRVEDFTALVHPDDREMLGGKIGQALRGDDGFSAEFRLLLREGRVKWLSTWARLSRTADGKPERMVGATISIDAYKQAEAALIDSDRRKDEFLAMLAHELRNPLAPISSAAQLLHMHLDEPPKVRGASEVILRQVHHITELVDDLLDVSRVTRGLIQLDRSVVDLDGVVGHAIEQSRPAIEARGHALTHTGGAGQARVNGDATRLVQAIVNILNNSAKYTPPGGRVGLHVQVHDAQARVTITDNGSGIDAALLPHVFELFAQGRRSPGRSEGGLGIGLALVKSIVELHDGRVSAHSDGIGKGSTFTLTLPLADDALGEALADAVPMAPPTAAMPVASGSGLRVMLVDDNRDAADTLALVLEDGGHAVQVMYDGRSALAGLQQPPPQVFILDIGLPDIDGYALARQLRERAGQAVYIALTGYGRAEERAQTRAAGFDHHFVKPVDFDQLDQVLAGVR